MLKLRVNPLVLAASLGLLGPAALADEDDVDHPAGMWRRSDDGAQRPSARLGEQIEVICVEDRVFLDDGTGSGAADIGQWTRLDDERLSQELVVDNSVVRREFRADGDALEVYTSVNRGGVVEAYMDRFTRLG